MSIEPSRASKEIVRSLSSSFLIVSLSPSLLLSHSSLLLSHSRPLSFLSSLNETFPENWFRIPNAYSFVDLLADIADLFLFAPQPLGRTYDGRFTPLEINLPTEPADLGCFALSALVDVAPGQVAGLVEVVNAVKDQIFKPIFKSVNCNIDDFNKNLQSSPNGSNISSLQTDGNDQGSGSGVFYNPPNKAVASSSSSSTTASGSKSRSHSSSATASAST